MRKGRGSASNSPVRESGVRTRTASQQRHISTTVSLPASAGFWDRPSRTVEPQDDWCAWERPVPVPVPVQEQTPRRRRLQSHVCPSTPRQGRAQVTPNPVMGTAAGYPVVCQRGVGSRFTPRPVGPCIHIPPTENSQSNNTQIWDAIPSKVMETPPPSLREQLEMWSPPHKQSRPCNRRSRSLSGNSARCHHPHRKQRAHSGQVRFNDHARMPRSGHWEQQAFHQEQLEARVHKLEQTMMELTMIGMSRFEELKPETNHDHFAEHDLESRCEHLLRSAETNVPSYPKLRATNESFARQQEHNKGTFHFESARYRSIECSPVWPVAAGMVPSSTGDTVDPLPHFPPTASSSQQQFPHPTVQTNNTHSPPSELELVAEVELLRAQVANLCRELTECQQSKLQVERNLQESTVEFQRSAVALLLQLEEIEAKKVNGNRSRRRSRSGGTMVLR